MIRSLICVTVLVLAMFTANSGEPPPQLDPWKGPIFEYASVRWSGDKTTIIWPDGVTQKVIAFGGKRRPDAIDERMWYMTGALNIMAKRGFEVVHMTSDEIFVKRPSPKD